MNTFLLNSRRLYLGSALALLASVAAAQTAELETADRVSVSGQKVGEIVKFNVSQTCPNIGANLQEAMSAQWGRYQATGQVRVDFKLSVNQVSEVSTQGGPREYAQAIKRAVRQLSCDANKALPENYAFIIDFTVPDAAPAKRAQLAQGQGSEPGGIALLTLDGR
jgi:hypothetical protein